MRVPWYDLQPQRFRSRKGSRPAVRLMKTITKKVPTSAKRAMVPNIAFSIFCCIQMISSLRNLSVILHHIIFSTLMQKRACSTISKRRRIGKWYNINDLLDSTDIVETKLHLQLQLCDVLGMTGFNLRKWSSNELEAIFRAPRRVVNYLMLNSIRELPKADTVDAIKLRSRKWSYLIQFVSSLSNESAIATLHEPLQFLSPFVLGAKILMQEIWTAEMSYLISSPNENIFGIWASPPIPYHYSSPIHMHQQIPLPRFLIWLAYISITPISPA